MSTARICMCSCGGWTPGNGLTVLAARVTGTIVAMPPNRTTTSYVERLINELGAIEAEYVDILKRSGLRNIDMNRGSGAVFFGFPKWAWVADDDSLHAARMRALAKVRVLRPRFLLLFAHPTPELDKRHIEALDLLERWLERPEGDTSVAASIDEAIMKVQAAIDVLRASRNLLPTDDFPVRLVVDTNALIDCPDLAAYTNQLGARYRVHVMPTALAELDDLKRAGRNDDLREAAKAAVRRLKGLRVNGDVLRGVTVAGQVSAIFEHVEPGGDNLPDWLDLTVGDDRLAAAALLLQSAHPASTVYVATSDINLQTKLAALGLPFVEPSKP